MHWDKDSWTVVSTVSTAVLAVWAAIQGTLKIRSDQREAREKLARELAEKERDRSEKDDPALMRERRAVERGAVDLKACWEQVDHWHDLYMELRAIQDAHNDRWAEVGLTDAEGLRLVRKWQESLGRNAVKEYDAGGIDPLKGHDNEQG